MQHTFTSVMTDHAAWQRVEDGFQRAFNSNSGRWLATVQGEKIALDRLSGTWIEPPRDVFVLPEALTGVPEMMTSLRSLGPVTRFRNVDLWDAIGTSIIRQVIRAGQSKKLYRAFCQLHGEHVCLPNGTTYALFPAPDVVLDLRDDEFTSLGMAFKRPPLRAAAMAYLEHGAKWRRLAPDQLITELQVVPRVGPWTARATVADWSNDWSLYPYADLAVRTWAKRVAPSHDWPSDESTFGQTWRALAGKNLRSLTLLTLAWGSLRGDIG